MTATAEAVAAAAAEAAAQLPAAQIVGNAFVTQYYHILNQSPELGYRFYQDISKLGRSEEDGSMSITTTMEAINEKIVSLNYGDFKAEIKSVDAQESLDGGVHVLVTGCLTGKEDSGRSFAQTFFLAPQEKGYFVLNDMFRYLDNVRVYPALVNDVALPVAPEPILEVPAPIQENHVSEESTPPAEEAVAGEVYNPPENENDELPNVEDDTPLGEVVDEEEEATQLGVESSVKIEELPKKSYASIVMHLQKSAPSPPPAAPRKAPPKNVEQVQQPTFTPATDGPAPGSESVDNGNQEGEADGYSIYVKGLPMNATEALLEDVFKKFGAIKVDGIQVRSNRQQVFCFGFVEFEEASSVQKALEASPVLIGGRQAFVEEKRSTNSRGNSKGRFQSGRSSGFRNEGGRGGRGNYGGGRGYNRGDFNGRGDFGNRGEFGNKGEFGNRGGNRGGSSNRDGYQRSDNGNSNGGGRMNRTGGMTNGNAKSTTPRVSTTA